jgi:hypothetical protein
MPDDRPEDMYRRGRPIIPKFDLDEQLYVRVNPSRIQPDGTIDPPHLRCPDLSSNRSTLSQPHFVLYPKDQFGGHAVFACLERSIPKTVQSENAGGGTPTVYNVQTHHDPEEDNYGHCETRLYRGTERMKENKLGTGAKMKFEAEMSRILFLIRKAGEPF